MRVTRAKMLRFGWKNKGLAVFVLLAAMLACATAASADPRVPDLEVTSVSVDRDTTQAGGHPKTKIIFEFCDQGAPILTATKNPGEPIHVTVAQPITLATPAAFVRHGRGLLGMNGKWNISAVGTTGTEFILAGSENAAGGAYVPNSGRLRTTVDVPAPTYLGCTANQVKATVKDFT